MPQLPLFVFGTLRRGECNHHYLAGLYDEVTPAKLLGFSRVEPLMIARQKESEVVGELFQLSVDRYSQTLLHCDELEEIPLGELIGSEYRRIAVRVTTDSDSQVAWAYVRPDTEPDEDLRPYCVAEPLP